MKMPDFKEAHPTADFLSCFDTIFDIMNSKLPNALGLKAPISTKNFEDTNAHLEKCKRYILGLKHGSGVSVFDGRRKATFFGWINDIECIRLMYKFYLQPGILKYLLTFKMSQDMLELFFCCIRLCCGFNNNPSVSQFKGAYKKLCAGVLLKTGVGANCLWSGEELLDMTKITEKNEEVHIEVTEEMMEKFGQHEASEYGKEVLTYIAGAVQRYVTQDLDCLECFGFFDKGDNLLTCSLIDKRDFGGLVHPTEDVVELVKCVNSIADSEAEDQNALSDKKILDRVLLLSEIIICDTKPYLFSTLCQDNAHKSKVIKNLIKIFLKIKIGHLYKRKTQSMKKEPDISIRKYQSSTMSDQI